MVSTTETLLPALRKQVSVTQVSGRIIEGTLVMITNDEAWFLDHQWGSVIVPLDLIDSVDIIGDNLSLPADEEHEASKEYLATIRAIVAENDRVDYILNAATFVIASLVLATIICWALFY